VGRLIPLLAAFLLTVGLVAAGPQPVAGFERFAEPEADSTFGTEIVFRTQLVGGDPDRLELLLRFGDDAGSTLVVPVEPTGGAAEWRWDAARNHVTPNTAIRHQWRAHQAGAVMLSPERTFVYADDRPGLDWGSERFGEATVHWYGDAETQARRFGELTAAGARRAEELLGHQLAGPIDIFVYRSQSEFFGALGPGAREWTGAAAFPALRTVFMWLEGGDRAYLERALVHEVTHVVFHDATDNPYHAPPKWLNEGIAVWSETSGAAQERSLVEFEARGGGLLAFEAISDQFPIAERQAVLAYAQGAAMVDIIIREHGMEAIPRIAAAYRDGATDDEALEAGTGRSAEALMADFFSQFGSEVPQPVEPEPLLPSNVSLPSGDRGSAGPGATPATDGAAPSRQPMTEVDIGSWLVLAMGAAGVIGLVLVGLIVGRRARARQTDR
jgi:hypothetical protein